MSIFPPHTILNPDLQSVKPATNRLSHGIIHYDYFPPLDITNVISWFITTSHTALLQCRVSKSDRKIRKWKPAAFTIRRRTASSEKSRRHPQNVNVTHKQLRCVCTHLQRILRAVSDTFTPRPIYFSTLRTEG